MLTAIPRVPCHERGVGLAFLEAMAREVPLGTTPGQLVHGSHTTGPPDDWQDFDLSQDALCFRAVTLCTGRSLVETLQIASQLSGDSSFTHTPGGLPYFGPAQSFVSYGWHGTLISELHDAMSSVRSSADFFWIDVFAIAQNQDNEERKVNNREDVSSFEAVVAATETTCLYWNPWATPTPLRRVWCLYEILCTIRIKHPLLFAISPDDLLAMRESPERLKFVIENLRSMDADATFGSDWYRIHIMIEEELHPDIPRGKIFPRHANPSPNPNPEP